MMRKKFPIGVQSFEKLIQEGYVYIDKTSYIYSAIHGANQYFLSRPRRFGKSLLLSTMKAYWEGKRELFKGLDIENLELSNPEAWQTYPVFYFDFNTDNLKADNSLDIILDEHLKGWEKIYGLEDPSSTLAARFQHILKRAYNQTGKRCVILVDEYDKQLIEAMDDSSRENHNKEVFKGFFSTLKSFDEYIQFVFITGVTKFSKVSIFSDLNQLKDISLSKQYAGICGITDEDIEKSFSGEISALAKEQGLSVDSCLKSLKTEYDGYHFHQSGEGIYNPYSLLNAFSDLEFKSYWYETGTPTFADCIVETDKYVYIFEFKMDKSAAEALEQIYDKEYAIPYKADSRTVYAIGANFDSVSRTLNDFVVNRIS